MLLTLADYGQYIVQRDMSNLTVPFTFTMDWTYKGLGNKEKDFAKPICQAFSRETRKALRFQLPHLPLALGLKTALYLCIFRPAWISSTSLASWLSSRPVASRPPAARLGASSCLVALAC